MWSDQTPTTSNTIEILSHLRDLIVPHALSADFLDCLVLDILVNRYPHEHLVAVVLGPVLLDLYGPVLRRIFRHHLVAFGLEPGHTPGFGIGPMVVILPIFAFHFGRHKVGTALSFAFLDQLSFLAVNLIPHKFYSH